MVSKTTIINSPAGLHARPATGLINFIKAFDCTVFLENGSKKANASSIINLLTLGASQGTVLTVVCDGVDEVKAVEEIATYIANIKD